MKNSLDRTAISVILALVVLLGGVILFGNPFDMTVSLVQPSVGTYGPLVLEFSAPADPAQVRRAALFQPGLLGEWQAESPRRLRFVPGQPLQPGIEYSLTLQPAALGVNGEGLNRPLTFIFRVRPVEVAYLSLTPRDLWRVAADGTSPKRLTDIGNIMDFAVSRDGEQIAFSVPNDTGGVDLWLTDRDGNATRMALDCGPDRCLTPDWSPDGRRIAYTRESAGLAPGAPPGAPRPWVFDLQAGQTAPIYEDPQVIGYDPSWSPDGRRLATYDGIQGGIRVLTLETGSEVLLPTYSALVGAWSPDGTQMLYPDVIETQDGYRTIIMLADFSTGEFSTFLEGGMYDAAYSVPVWSPDRRYVAVGLRPEADSPSREVWLINPATLGGPTIPTIDSDAGVTFDFYQWNPWGTALVVQRAALKGKYHPEIMVYSLETGKQVVVATDAGWPQWLP